MSDARAAIGAADDLIAVARVIKPRGIRGEVVAELLTDFPERFDDLAELIAVTPTGERRTLAVEESWLHSGRIVFKFAGYDTPEAARELAGYELTVPEAEAVKLEADEYYDWQLIGCRVVTIDNEEVGHVREVLHAGAAPVLIIADATHKREHLIPLAASICVEIDIAAKLIRVDPPEGLIES
jgi:16S rRNA processing protein RimM